jgi:hypothetical protein
MLPTSALSTTKTRLERRCGGTSVWGPVSVIGHQAAHAAPIFKIDGPLALIPEDRQRLSGSRGGTVRSLRRAHQRGRHSLNLSRLLSVRRT